MPTLSASRAPRDSRRWRQTAHRSRPVEGAENRRFLWLLAATVAVVLGVVVGLLVKALPAEAAPGQASAYEQVP